MSRLPLAAALALLTLALVPSSPSHGDATPPPSGYGTLSVQTLPWTYVYVDGKKVKPTPLMNHRLAPGKHTVTLLNKDLEIEKKYVVEIVAGYHTTIVKKFDADGNEVKPAAPQDAGDSPSSDPPGEVVAGASPEPADASTLGPPPPDLVRSVQEPMTRGSGCGCAIVL